jgi:hypothetical protein
VKSSNRSGSGEDEEAAVNENFGDEVKEDDNKSAFNVPLARGEDLAAESGGETMVGRWGDEERGRRDLMAILGTSSLKLSIYLSRVLLVIRKRRIERPVTSSRTHFVSVKFVYLVQSEKKGEMVCTFRNALCSLQ